MKNHKKGRLAGKIFSLLVVLPVLMVSNFPVSERLGDPALTPEVSMLAVGDIRLGQDGENLAKTQPQGPDYPFALVGGFTRSADLTFGSLGSPFYSPSQTGSLEDAGLVQAGPGYAAALKEAGFNTLSFGGPQALDYGATGVLGSVKSLNEAGIEVSGAGENPDSTLFIEKNGLKLALIAASQDAANTQEKAGNYIARFDPARVLDRIREARQQADVVMVALNWGDADHAGNLQWQQDWAAQASAAGADLILGNQSQNIGPFDVLNHRTVVAYSLGSFIPASGYSPSSRESAGLYLTLDKEGVASATAIPLALENDRPRPLLPQEQVEGLGLLSQSTPKDSAFQAKAIYWNGTDWATGPGLSYRREASPNGRITLPLNRAIQVQDLSGEQGGYSNGPVTGDTNPANEQTTVERIVLKEGRLSVWRPVDAGWVLTFESPPQWQVQQYTFGDADEDGRPELMFSLWKNNGPDDEGQNRSHPFIYGWRRGAFRPVWAGSALADPIREFALGAFKGNGHNQLVVLEGNYTDPPDAPARYVTVWQWNGWGYELLFRSPQGSYFSLDFVPGQPYAFFKQNS